MKIYILRDPKSVQPQTARFVETPDSQTAALVEGIGAAAAAGVGEGRPGCSQPMLRVATLPRLPFKPP